MPAWYALHVASCTEAIVSRRLGEADIESYYPAKMEKSLRQYRPDVQRRYFPGYVFARFELAERTPVIQIPMVISILGTAHVPEAIADVELEAIRLMVQSASASLASHPPTIGESVTVTGGPLRGLVGTVMHLNGKTRVAISVGLLKQSISCEVELKDLAPAAA